MQEIIWQELNYWNIPINKYLNIPIKKYWNRGILVACGTQIFGIITVGENPGGMAGQDLSASRSQAALRWLSFCSHSHGAPDVVAID